MSETEEETKPSFDGLDDRQIIDHIFKLTREYVENGEDVLAILDVYTKDEHTILGLDLPEFTEQKSYMLFKVGQMFKGKGVTKAIFITDAWVKKFDKDEDASRMEGPVRNMPGRKEALVSQILYPDKFGPIATQVYTRLTNEDGSLKIEWEEIEFAPGDGRNHGITDSFFKGALG